MKQPEQINTGERGSILGVVINKKVEDQTANDKKANAEKDTKQKNKDKMDTGVKPQSSGTQMVSLSCITVTQNLFVV